jgi:flagellar biosynthesis GTPase FlhF
MIQFRGGTAEEVFQKVHQALGPNAVVVQLKRITAGGISRIWGATEIEAWARPADPIPTAPPARRAARPVVEVDLRDVLRSWRLDPETIRIIQRHLPTTPRGSGPEQGGVLAAAGLLAAWDHLGGHRIASPRRIALIGPPGSGKSACTAKWLTVEVIRNHRSCRIWRLDGAVVNGAEALSLHAELIGVPVESAWNPSVPAREVEFIDLPGWNATDQDLNDRMANLLDRFDPDFVGLVLNAAYDPRVLDLQARAFGVARPTGLILTHLDELQDPARIWDLTLQLQLPLIATSSGPWVPGGFDRLSGEQWVERLLESV